MPAASEFDPRRIEEASLRAWPAAQQLLYDGWIVRISDGYTKRANSAVLLYPQPDSDTEPVVDQIERVYRHRTMPVIFRLLSFTATGDIDRRLEERGYRAADETLVLTRSLGSPLEIDTAICSLDLEEGIAAHARMNGIAAEKLPAHRAILDRIPNGLSFCGIRHQHEVITCGCSVFDGDLVGLFDIVTAPQHRRQGHAGRLVLGMLAQAQTQGAKTAYLQVVASNRPAIALYQSLGFEPAYSYRYRLLDR